MIRRIPWWAALGLLALLARLAWRFGADEPLLYSHQYHYWEGALRIVEHPRPFWYLLHSDEWRQWPLGGPWTIAPLYYVFLAGLLAISAGSLVFVQVVQSALDALVAVAVGHLGARAAGSSRGHWAGVAYAFFFPAIQLCNSTMTEALHTPLLALAFVLLARAIPEEEGGRDVLRVAALAGLAFGLGALARTVGLAFVPVGAALLLMRHRGRGWKPAAALVLAAALPIVPWAVRNRVLLDDPSPIESASVANLLIDNVYVEGERYDRLEHFVFQETTPAARKDRAMEFVKQGLRKRYHLIPAKVRHNATHFLRPEGLWVLLGVQQPWPAWRHVLNILLDDLWLVLIPPLFLAWLVAGRGPLRAMLLAWTALYLFLILIVFHSEIRYRMPLAPYAMAGAAGGIAVLARGDRRARLAALAGACVIALVSIAPFAGPAWRGVVAAVRLQAAGNALARGDIDAAAEAASRAAAADPTSTWPWIRYARWLVRAGRPADALDAYARAAPLRELPWEPTATRPPLLAELGRVDEARAAAAEANRLAGLVDPAGGRVARARPAAHGRSAARARGPGRGAPFPPAEGGLPLVTAARPGAHAAAHRCAGLRPGDRDGGSAPGAGRRSGRAGRGRRRGRAASGDRFDIRGVPHPRPRPRRRRRRGGAARASVEPCRPGRIARRRGPPRRAGPDRPAG